MNNGNNSNNNSNNVASSETPIRFTQINPKNLGTISKQFPNITIERSTRMDKNGSRVIDYACSFYNIVDATRFSNYLEEMGVRKLDSGGRKEAHKGVDDKLTFYLNPNDCETINNRYADISSGFSSGKFGAYASSQAPVRNAAAATTTRGGSSASSPDPVRNTAAAPTRGESRNVTPSTDPAPVSCFSFLFKGKSGGGNSGR